MPGSVSFELGIDPYSASYLVLARYTDTLIFEEEEVPKNEELIFNILDMFLQWLDDNNYRVGIDHNRNCIYAENKTDPSQYYYLYLDNTLYGYTKEQKDYYYTNKDSNGFLIVGADYDNDGNTEVYIGNEDGYLKLIILPK